MGTDLKRQTLILGGTGEPASPRLALPPPPHIRRSMAPDAVDSGWDSTPPGSLTPTATSPVSLPPVSLSPKPPVSVPRPTPRSLSPIPAPVTRTQPIPSHDLSSQNLVDDDDRPSDRVTVPNELAPKKIVELSASNLENAESDRSLATTRPPPPLQPTLEELALALRAAAASLGPANELVVDESTKGSTEPVPDAALTPSSIPPLSLDVRPPMTSLPGQTAHSMPVSDWGFTRQHAVLFAASHLAVAAGVLFWVYATRPEPKLHPRSPRLALEDRVPLGTAAGAAPEIAIPDGCVVQDLARVIAPRAELGPGLDASVLEQGFGIGLVSKTNEATGIRLDPSTLRTAETIRVRSVFPVARVAVGSGDEDSPLDVRIDGNDSRSFGGERPQKVYAQKGGVFRMDAAGQSHLLWAIPGAVPKTQETVRAASRSDGTTTVALRRPGVLWVGVTGADSIKNQLVPVVRAHKTIGSPAIAGTTMAWAERGASGPFSIVAAEVENDGTRTTVGTPLDIVDGISPALATLPNGELLLTYADGAAGAHRVVAQRLGSDLSKRGDLLVLSGAGTNAGQPAVAVDADGRAIVAYLAIENGRAEVHATALTCR